MRKRLIVLFTTLFALALVPTFAHANARLVSVTPVDDGCVAGPAGPNVEAWDVEILKTYTLTIDNVTECSGATINVMVKNTAGGNIDLVATLVSAGVYRFQFTVPVNYCETSPMRYGVTPGRPNTGYLLGRHDTGLSQAHLRYSAWDPGCLSPVEIECTPVSTGSRTWGMIKTLYR
jgi:hypothetical protein